MIALTNEFVNGHNIDFLVISIATFFSAKHGITKFLIPRNSQLEKFSIRLKIRDWEIPH